MLIFEEETLDEEFPQFNFKNIFVDTISTHLPESTSILSCFSCDIKVENSYFRYSGSFITSNDSSSTGGLFFVAKLLGNITLTNSTFYQIIGVGSLLMIEEVTGDIFISNCNFIKNYYLFAFLRITEDDELYEETFIDKKDVNQKLFSIKDSVFYQNYGLEGGAISSYFFESRLINCTFLENYAEHLGGALSISSQNILVETSIFLKNSAMTGGAIIINNFLTNKNEDMNLTIKNCFFSENIGLYMAGAIFTENEIVGLLGEITNSYFYKNLAIVGGVFHLNHLQSSIKLQYCSFINNMADFAGVLFSYGGGLVDIYNSSFIGNAALNISFSFHIFKNYFESIKSSIFILSNSKYQEKESEVKESEFPYIPFSYEFNLTPSTISITKFRGGIFVLDFQIDFFNVTSFYCLFKRNLAIDRGGVSLLRIGNHNDYGSMFIENLCGGFGGVIDSEDGSKSMIRNSLFIKNYAENSGSVFYGYENIVLDLDNIIAMHNGYALRESSENQVGGIFCLLHSCNLYLKNSFIHHNTAKYASFLYLYESGKYNMGVISIISVILEDNYSDQALVWTIESKLYIEKTNFKNNRIAGLGTPGILSNGSPIVLKEIIFDYHPSNCYYVLIVASSLSIIELSDSIIKDCTSKISTMRIEQSLLKINNCLFLNLTGIQYTGGIYIKENSKLVLNNSFFIKNYGGKTSDIYFQNCHDIDLLNVSIVFNHNSMVFFAESSFLRMEKLFLAGSSMFRSSILPNNVVFLKNLYRFEIKFCHFQYLDSVNSPIYFIFENSNKQRIFELNYSVENCIFENLYSANDGGAAYLKPFFDFIINNTIFKGNIAKRMGGAIYYEESFENNTLFIYNTTFINNLADLEGGAIKLKNKKPVLINITYQNNFAYYGNNLASSPFKALLAEIIQLDVVNTNLVKFDNSEAYAKHYCSFNNSNNSVTNCFREQENQMYRASLKSLENIEYISNFKMLVKGSTIVNNQIIVLLLDEYNQIVPTQNARCEIKKDETSFLDYNSTDKNYYKSDSKCDSCSQYLSRLRVFPSNMGIIIVSEFQVDYTPGLSLLIKLNVQPEFSSSQSDINDISYLSVWIKIDISECLIGLEELQNNTCRPCKNDEFSVRNNSSACYKCPTTHAFCQEGDQIYPKIGYYVLTNSTSIEHDINSIIPFPKDQQEISRINIFINYLFKRCTRISFNQTACKQNYSETYKKNYLSNPQYLLDESIMNLCEDGYTGLLCLNCKSKYYKVGQYFCEQCDLEPGSSLFKILMSFLFLFFLIMLYFQGMENLFNGNLNKISKNTIIIFKASFSFIHSFSLAYMIFIPDWPDYYRNSLYLLNLISSLGIHEFQCLFQNNDLKDYQVKLLFTIVLIVAIILGMLAFSFISIYNYNDYSYLKVFLLPFSCESVNGLPYKVLHNDYSVKCWEGEHLTWMLTAVLPFGLIWLFILPLIALYKIYQRYKKKNLDDSNFLQKYGAISIVYNEDNLFWEFYIYLLKIISNIVYTFLTSGTAGFQGLFFFILASLAYIRQESRKPYESKAINEFASHNFLNNMMLFFLGIAFYFINVSYEDDIYNAYLSGQRTLDTFKIHEGILFMQAFFFFIWIFSVLYSFKYFFKLAFKYIQSIIPTSVERKIMKISCQSKFFSKKKNKFDNIKLSKEEIAELLVLFNHMNIFNIENENATWSELISLMGHKKALKFMKTKKKFVNFCLKTETKLRKILKSKNFDSTYRAKDEKILVNSLVFLELLIYDESNDFKIEELDIDKKAIKEYKEAKKFLQENYPQLKKNIEDEIFLIFKKKRAKETRKKKMQASEFFSQNSSILKKQEEEKNDEEALALFQSYLFKKKYEVVDELASFQEEVLDENGNNIFSIDRFLSEVGFKKYVQEMNAIKKKKYEDSTIMQILQVDPSNEKELLEKYDEQFNNLFEEVRKKISEKLMMTNEKKKMKKKKNNQQIMLEDKEKNKEEEINLKNDGINFSFSVNLDDRKLEDNKWEAKLIDCCKEKEALSFEEIKT